MKGYRLKVIRHGRTDANFNASYIGVTDLPLCKEGKEELFQKQEQFDYGTVQKVYTSPLLRCVQTANIFYPNSYTEKVNEIREMNFGEFEGKSADELINVPEFKEWLKGGLDNSPPQGESLRAMIERCYEGFDYIIKDMMAEGMTNCAVVTHGGVIMNSLSCFGLPKLKPMEFSSDVGEGFELIATAQMWQRDNVFEILGKYPYSIECINEEEKA